MTYILKVTNHGILAQRSPTGLAKSGHKIQAKNNARSSVLRNTKPLNRLPLQNTHFSISDSCQVE